MTKQTKTIEDYPELNALKKNLIKTQGLSTFHGSMVALENRLLSMQETISTQRNLEAQLQGEVNDLEVKVREQQNLIDELTEQNKELKAHNQILSDAIKAESGWISSFEKVELSPSDALAQHDKELILKFVKGLFDKNGLLISRGSIVYFRDGFIEKLQEQK